jgi:hypothetical protein
MKGGRASGGKNVAIPAFEATGLLPVGRHTATEAEIEAALVTPFAGSATRRPIFDLWQQHRLALKDFLTVLSQWVDGSFVTNVLDPHDIDVVTFFDGPAFDILPLHQQIVVGTLLANKYTQAVWACDAYPVPMYPPGHPAHPLAAAAQAYWDTLFGHTKVPPPAPGDPKGYLEVA